MTPAFQGEVMLLDWSETAKGGAKIVLQLDSPQALAPFRSMTLAKRGVAGQRLMCVMVEIGDDEQPVEPHPKGGPLSQLAGRWCNDPRFRAWLHAEFGGENGTPEDAADTVRMVCEIASRAELDHDANAAGTFNALIREPYTAYLKQENDRG